MSIYICIYHRYNIHIHKSIYVYTHKYRCVCISVYMYMGSRLGVPRSFEEPSVLMLYQKGRSCIQMGGGGGGGGGCNNVM